MLTFICPCPCVLRQLFLRFRKLVHPLCQQPSPCKLQSGEFLAGAGTFGCSRSFLIPLWACAASFILVTISHSHSLRPGSSIYLVQSQRSVIDSSWDSWDIPSFSTEESLLQGYGNDWSHIRHSPSSLHYHGLLHSMYIFPFLLFKGKDEMLTIPHTTHRLILFPFFLPFFPLSTLFSSLFLTLIKRTKWVNT